MIGIRSAISIRARGQRPHLEAVYMTAPRFICSNTKKALAERGPSIHDGVLWIAHMGNGCVKDDQPPFCLTAATPPSGTTGAPGDGGSVRASHTPRICDPRFEPVLRSG